MAGGLLVTAVTLSIIVVDQVVNGGSGAIRATCVLFLWSGGAAIALGMVLRILGTRSRFFTAPRPHPQRRSRRSPSSR
jgi:NADH:ubiquinone oxidoreductase subunit K